MNLQIGQRIEIPTHYDMWMRGARFGVVTSIVRNIPGLSDCAYIKLDARPNKRLRLWRVDWEYARAI
jgi:hypothetical protein